MIKLNFFKTILVNIFLISVIFVLFNCAQLTKDLLKDPDVKILDVSVAQMTAESVSVNLKLNINNPNPIPLKLGKVGYNLKLSGLQVTEGVFEKGIDIPAAGANDVVIPLTFKYDAVGSLVNSLFKKTLSKEYELTGSADLGLFSIPFSKKGEINLKK